MSSPEQQPPSRPADSPVVPPERLSRKIRRWEGEAGARWIEALPALVTEYCARWELIVDRVMDPGGRLSMSLLVTRADGTPAVLKFGWLNEETRHEAAALRIWGGRGAVRLLESDDATGALLMERLQPHISLRSLPEKRAMLEAEEVARRLWVAPGEEHPFRTVEDRRIELTRELYRYHRLPELEDARGLIDAALLVGAELAGDQPEQVLLHGDLHHGNVLAGERLPWLAIDPRPLVGERAYDLAWLVRERLETLVATPGPRSATRRRIRELASALEVDEQRLLGWALFRSVAAGARDFALGETEDGEMLLELATWL
ncbi:aminoglycoside phosphotransferase family protein [Allostreptomyces psammosilenae]|uniref:Streptomycin 6-kinase n=1 Tax=Allostreptomyces psammosilenae TaxID=1892865 RepID=A0A853A2S5_9ACTN|nr:aminoglycoside phosphotransferase family protein [Allostreptomyces psammosilenae]NYI08437.1 streptomycin 6-kinase [Allostreptomyces psammosilenae]